MKNWKSNCEDSTKEWIRTENQHLFVFSLEHSLLFSLAKAKDSAQFFASTGAYENAHFSSFKPSWARLDSPTSSNRDASSRAEAKSIELARSLCNSSKVQPPPPTCNFSLVACVQMKQHVKNNPTSLHCKLALRRLGNFQNFGDKKLERSRRARLKIKSQDSSISWDRFGKTRLEVSPGENCWHEISSPPLSMSLFSVSHKKLFEQYLIYALH